MAPPTRPHPLASAAAAGRSALAALAAGLTLMVLLPRGVLQAGLLAAVTYLAVSLLGRMLERGGRLGAFLDPERSIAERELPTRAALRRRLPRRPEVGSLVVEALAWTAGVPVAAAGLAVGGAEGRRLTLALVASLALLAVEAARLAGLRAAGVERLGHLDRVRSAGQRMVGGVAEIEAAVERIREEVANVVPFHWFQFELLAAERDGSRSWWAAGLAAEGGGELHEGVPRPDEYPPPLPGIHRRPEWRILERNLAWGERAGARLRLWCDPRQLDGEDLELLDALLPQMSASIRQSLLDREAREDRLTGTAVRRVLEKRLLGAYRSATDAGRPLAVIMCDLDHFKAINDTHGHLTGDQALAACAAALLQHKRSGDLLARYGGEEFTLLLEETDGDTALQVAERLRRGGGGARRRGRRHAGAAAHLGRRRLQPRAPRQDRHRAPPARRRRPLRSQAPRPQPLPARPRRRALPDAGRHHPRSREPPAGPGGAADLRLNGDPQASRTETPYCAIRESRVTMRKPSDCACATSMRSKGSR